MPPRFRRHDRRSVLRAFGTLSTAGLVGLAGCGGGEGGDGDDGDGAPSGDEYPAIDDWLTETDVGGADDTYDGTLDDRRGTDEITIDVGSEGNGGNFAFGLSAVVVSAGTTVVWEWTGEGGLHNVVAEPDEQLGESDYTFSSGDPVDTAGVEYSRTLDEPGVALYKCVPHLALGMKGGIVVE
jgi:halocyanin-like protein